MRFAFGIPSDKETGSQERKEPIDAKDSRLILEALADGLRPGLSADLSPRVAFLRLGLTEQDG